MLYSSLLVGLLFLLAIAIGSVRRVPEGQAWTVRRVGGHRRLLGAGTHLLLPLLERVAHRINLGGTALTVESTDTGRAQRATVYFQILDPERVGSAVGQIERLLRSQTRSLLGSEALPDGAEARRSWLKQRLNATFAARGLLIARVDL